MSDIVYVLIIWIGSWNHSIPHNAAVIGSYATPADCEAGLIEWRKQDPQKNFGTCLKVHTPLELK